jgi:UDP-N-acetylglucosamine enolpyruvyl transferase
MEKPKLINDKKDQISTSTILILVAIVVITIMALIVTEPMRVNYEKIKNVGISICENLSFIYLNYDSNTKEVVCRTNVTYPQEHFNITPEQLIIRIEVDWAYYNITKKGN